MLCREGERIKLNYKGTKLKDVLDSTEKFRTEFEIHENNGINGAINTTRTVFTDQYEGRNLTVGEFTCRLLLDILNKPWSAEINERKIICSTLAALFAVSYSAKKFACKSGFTESVVDDISDLHNKLNIASLQLNKDINGKRKEKIFLTELSNLFSLVRNYVYKDTQIKVKLPDIHNSSIHHHVTGAKLSL